MPFVQFNDLVRMVSDAEERAMDARQSCQNSLFYLTTLKLKLLQGSMKTFMHDMSSIKKVNFEKPKRRSSILNTEEEADDNAYIRDYIKLDLPRLKNLCHGAAAVETAFRKGKISAGPMALMTTEFYGADVALEESGIPIGMTTDVEVRKTLNLPVFDQAVLSRDPARMNDNLVKVKEYQQLCSQYIEIMDELREQASLIYNCLYNMDHSWFASVQESLHKLVGSKGSMDKRMRNLMGQKTYSSDDMDLIHNTVSMAQFIQMLMEANIIDRYGNFTIDTKRAVAAVQKKMGSEISLPTPAVQQSLLSLEDTLKNSDEDYARYLKYKAEKAATVHAMEEQARQAEASRQAEEARKAEEQRRAEEIKKAEQARVLEEARQAIEAKKEKERRQAEQEKLAAEQARRAEEARKAEQARQALEQMRQKEQERKAEEARQAEEQRILEEACKAEQVRQEEEKRRAEQARLAEEKERQAEAVRKEWVAAEQARQAAQSSNSQSGAGGQTVSTHSEAFRGPSEVETPSMQSGVQMPAQDSASSREDLQDSQETGEQQEKAADDAKSGLLQKRKVLKKEKKTADKKQQGVQENGVSEERNTEQSWRKQQEAAGKSEFSFKDLPEFPKIVLWMLAGILLLSAVWKLYTIAILSAVVLIGAALIVSPLVMKYVHQWIKIGSALVLILISLVMPNQLIPIPHDSGDSIVTAVQKIRENREKNRSDPVKELHLNYLGTNLTKEQFEAKYQGYQENYQGKQGVKPEEAEKFLQDFLYNKKNLYANEELITLGAGNKESVSYQVIHMKKPTAKKLTMFISAEEKNYKIVITKQKEDKIKLSKKKVK